MKKYIERELALSFPFANGRYDEENANIDFICGCETYKEYLESLPYFEVEEWIPVTEILPKIGENVLVSFIAEYYRGGCKYVDRGVAITNRCGNKSWCGFLNDEIEAWQPLPNHYEREKE